MLHVYDVLMGYASDSSIVDIGFWCSHQQAKQMAEENFMFEDELATHLGQLCAHNSVARIKRWAMVLGAQPLAAFLFLLKKKGITFVNTFHRQWDQHRQVLSINRPTPFTNALITRSCLNQISVQQVKEALQEHHWKTSQPFNE